MWSCRRLLWLICPTMVTSCHKAPWIQSANSSTSWTGFWTAASRWVWSNSQMEKIRQLHFFLKHRFVLCFQCQGGNGVVQRVRRLVYDTKLLIRVSGDIISPASCLPDCLSSDLWPLCPLSVQSLFSQAPLLGFFLLGFPFTIATFFCYLCCKARPTTSEDEDDVAPQQCKKVTNKKSDWRGREEELKRLCRIKSNLFLINLSKSEKLFTENLQNVEKWFVFLPHQHWW